MIWAIPAAAAVGLLLLYSGLTARRVASASSTRARINATLQEAGVRMSASQLALLVVMAFVSAFLLGAGVTGSAVVGSITAAAAAWAPIAYVRSKRDRRRRSYREAWPHALATMIAGIRAGTSLPEICIALGDKGPQSLQDAFRSFASTYRASGSFDAGLTRLREEVSDPIADRVATALGLANEVGGTDLVRVLRTLADFIREDLRIRKEIEARWSWTVTAARVAAASPWIVLVMMSTRPEASAAYSSPTGGLVILAGACATFVGYRAMLRAARLPEEQRLDR